MMEHGQQNQDVLSMSLARRSRFQGHVLEFQETAPPDFVLLSVALGLMSGPAASQMVLGTLILHVKGMCGKPRMVVILAPDHLEDQEIELQRQEVAEEGVEEQRFQAERATIFQRLEEENKLGEEVAEVELQER